ncbi:MAG: MotA/TolQ/ExbB proton channel family protein [Deltaproteobacteria bacterium]|nr:MotA/TolQ/ExbB proton channel family protein [Deltaproteobacteria bacterium]
MNIVEWLKRIMVGFGAGWVMWLMIALSVVSVAIILERSWFFWSLRDDLAVLAADLRAALEKSIDAARKRMEASPSAEAAVVLAGLAMADRGPDAAREAMAGAAALQRMKLERRLAYLATLGNNAPFIGLFGTVIGIVGAFEALGQAAQAPMAEAAAQPMAPQAVMTSIAEALVATAIGIAIAIPAVAANNYFQRATRSILANTEALTHVLLAFLRSSQGEATPGGGAAGDGEPVGGAGVEPAGPTSGQQGGAARAPQPGGD